tara:strand:+ start:2949 stop:3149 length:201 start_codon:yes stop_codon:yes gene_type:complete
LQKFAKLWQKFPNEEEKSGKHTKKFQKWHEKILRNNEDTYPRRVCKILPIGKILQTLQKKHKIDLF